jgi:hypothetical protein
MDPNDSTNARASHGRENKVCERIYQTIIDGNDFVARKRMYGDSVARCWPKDR